jgi:transcription elongation GreA/GreB family factor
MGGTERVWMTRHAHKRLQTELDTLVAWRCADVAHGADEVENLVILETRRKDRIREVTDLLNKAIVCDTPVDTGTAGPGMVITVGYDTGLSETFLLGVPGAEDDDIPVYSVRSPLGRAVVGASTGQRRTYRVASGANLPVTLLKVVPYDSVRRASTEGIRMQGVCDRCKNIDAGP